MAHGSLVRAVPSGLLLFTTLACSTADGLDTGGGGGGTGDQDPEDPDKPAADPHGDACGPEVIGWQTDCTFVGQILYENPLAPGEHLELEPFEGTTVACCEGAPSTATADSACVDVCVAKLCRIAKDIYQQIAHENEWNCIQGCGFDTEACLAGIPTQQFPHPPSGNDYPHEVEVACEATNVQPRHPDGVFEFIDIPENHEYNDPQDCRPDPGAGLEPLGSLAANTVVDDAGSHARATWWTGGERGPTG